MYGIRSVSAEGTYYLVNGWKKHNTFWSRYPDPAKCGFRTKGYAARSLNRLFEIMPEYLDDEISLVRFNEQTRKAEVICIAEKI